MTNEIDFLREDVFRKRLGGFAGGNQILWSETDVVEIRDYVMSAKRDQLVRAAHPIETKLSAEPLNIAKIGIEVKSDMGATDNPIFIISSPRVDLVGDSVNLSGVDLADFRKNS